MVYIAAIVYTDTFEIKTVYKHAVIVICMYNTFMFLLRYTVRLVVSRQIDTDVC